APVLVSVSKPDRQVRLRQYPDCCLAKASHRVRERTGGDGDLLQGSKQSCERPVDLYDGAGLFPIALFGVEIIKAADPVEGGSGCRDELQFLADLLERVIDND